MIKLYFRKTIKAIDNIIFLITKIVFVLVPLALMYFGGGLPIAVILIWFFEQSVEIGYTWYILLGILLYWVGYQWDDAVIDYYPTATRKREEFINKNK